MLEAHIVLKDTEEVIVYEEKQLLGWIEKLNKDIHVSIKRNNLSDSDFWFYDDKFGCIRNKNNSFFRIEGIQVEDSSGNIISQQPIIIQDEIGYLGIICKVVDGSVYFLMQAKIEPGNVNKIQISPTIQATKSNFTQMHGGKKPPYLEYFTNVKAENIIVDQIQSEQSSRFYKKRNRNTVILVNEDIEVLPNYKWMTLFQIKQLMKIDNLVNMDTRTVISCIPLDSIIYKNEKINNCFDQESVTKIFKYINDYKMFNENKTRLIRLDELYNWEIDDYEIKHKKEYDFSVIFCDIEVEGREVKSWTQPLFKAEGFATFGLFTKVIDGTRKFLVKCKPEIGCFDGIELGPTIQIESTENKSQDSIMEKFFYLYNKKEGILNDVILSEEGGRFYHEQNYNIIIDLEENDLEYIPAGYFWLDIKTLNHLVQINNCLNIQLRNLLSILDL